MVTGSVFARGGTGGVGGAGGNGGNGGNSYQGSYGIGNGGSGGVGGSGGGAGTGGSGGNITVTNSSVGAIDVMGGNGGDNTNIAPGGGGNGGNSDGSGTPGYGGSGGNGGGGGNAGGAGTGGSITVINSVISLTASTPAGSAGGLYTVGGGTGGTGGYPGGSGGNLGNSGSGGNSGNGGSISVTDAAPVVTLTGASSISLFVGDTYTELGATATDAKDGTRAVTITGSLDTNTAGTYTKTYTATDLGTSITYNSVLTVYQAARSASTTRTIVVEALSNSSGSAPSSRRGGDVQDQDPALRASLESQIRILTELLQKQNELKRNIDEALEDDNPFFVNLSLHTKHADVLRLQRFLNYKGFAVAAIGDGSLGFETDYFGLKTYGALIKFQAAVGLPSTGFFGPLTRSYINSR